MRNNDGVRDRLSLEAAYEEMISRDWQLAVNEDWEREQCLKVEALRVGYEASGHLPTLMEFIGEAPVGSSVFGPEGRVLMVEEHGWLRVTNNVGQTNHRGLLASVAYEALMDGRISR
jgi:hypothetical protein